MTFEGRRLYRSSSDRMVAGVCGGLGVYLGVDPVLFRVAWVAAILLGGFGLLLYIVWIFVVPVGPAVEPPAGRVRNRNMFGIVAGGGLMLLGVLLLLDTWFWIDLEDIWHWSWRYMGPLMLIGLGVFFILGSRRSEPDSTDEQPAGGVPHAGPERLHKSYRDRKLFGVCGGIAEYFQVDATLVRLLVVGLTLAAPAVGILGYVVLAILTPAAHAEPTSAGQGA